MTIPIFTSSDDKYRRLEGCFALVEGEPYIISAHPSNDLKPEEVFGFRFRDKRGRDYEKLNYTKPEVRIKDLPLGYVDLSNQAVYVSRHPARTTSVGPSKSNLYYDAGQQGFYNFCNNFGYSMLADLFVKKYVGMEEAVGRITSGASISVPLSNDLSIVKVGPKMYAAHYKETTLGYTKDLREPFDCILPRGFINLISEKLTAAGINVKH